MGWGSWEGGNKKKLVYLKSRWGEYKIYCVKFPFKKLSIFEKKCISWGGGHGRGATTSTITTITTSKFLRPLGVENSEFPILVSSCSGM